MIRSISAWWRRVTGQPYVHSYRDDTSIYESLLTRGPFRPTDAHFHMPFAWPTEGVSA